MDTSSTLSVVSTVAASQPVAQALVEQAWSFSGLLWNLFFILLLVAANGFFVASEFAIVKVRETQLYQLAEDGSSAARLGLSLTHHLDAYLSATQLGITITSILLGWIGEPAISRYVISPIFTTFSLFPNQPWVMHTTSILFGTGLITLLHVVLGELMPKSIAIQKPQATTLFCVYPLYAFYRVMYPAIALLNGTANALLRLIGIHPAGESEQAHTEEELRQLVQSSKQHGVISNEAQDLLENVFDLRETFIREIALPRNEVIYFDINEPLQNNISRAYETAHSRYPLADKDLDHVIGIIHMKDFFWKMMEAGVSTDMTVSPHPDLMGGIMTGDNIPSDGSEFMRKIARPLTLVPETLTLDQALKLFRLERIHLALVVDEFGVVTGMVTFENIIEAIVGEVRDEFDNAELSTCGQIVPQMLDTFAMLGETKIDDANEALGTELEAEDVNTIAGLFLREAGHLPQVGERIIVDNVEMTALEVRGLRLTKMRLRKLTDEELETLDSRKGSE